jgi:hypothetical protein
MLSSNSTESVPRSNADPGPERVLPAHDHAAIAHRQARGDRIRIPPRKGTKSIPSDGAQVAPRPTDAIPGEFEPMAGHSRLCRMPLTNFLQFWTLGAQIMRVWPGRGQAGREGGSVRLCGRLGGLQEQPHSASTQKGDAKIANHVERPPAACVGLPRVGRRRPWSFRNGGQGLTTARWGLAWARPNGSRSRGLSDSADGRLHRRPAAGSVTARARS